eukprot:jgi/Psemu1/259787/estExt_Genewise1Plus.C_3820022
MRANGRRPRTLNPAFAAAHGLSSNNPTDEPSDNHAHGEEEIGASGNGNSNGNGNLEIVLKRARDTGKLVASNCAGLKTNGDASDPLPDALFEFPFRTSRYTEELLTAIDFSDNEEHLGSDRVLDERILRYRSAQSLRFRNCGFRLPPGLSFSSLEHLSLLDLSGNRLEGSLDLGFLLWSPSRVSALVELNLSHNRIRELRARSSLTEENNGAVSATIRFPNLQSLDVSHNPPLESLFEGDDLVCENLRVLRCHHNPNLKASPDATRGLFPFLRSASTTLEVIEASHAPLLGASARGAFDLSGFLQLQTVSLALSKVETVPLIPPSVRSLNLRSNKLVSIAGMFPTTTSENDVAAAASQMVDLILADNYLTRLDPSVVGRMTLVKRLDLSLNKLLSFPYQLGFLTDLSILDVSGNPAVTKFPPSVIRSSGSGKPQALMELLRNRAPASNNRATGDSGDHAAPSRLLTAALSSKGRMTLDLAGKLPQQDAAGAALEGLVGELRSRASLGRDVTGQLLLDSNRLESLPDELLTSCLPNVQSISLADNRFAELPASLQRCCSALVTKLYLSKNLLSSDTLARAGWFAPPGGWSLHSVTHLDLSSNRLTSFPLDVAPETNCFPALEVLNLYNNRIDSVEDWERLPSSLTTLELSENRIEDAEPLSIRLSAHCPGLQRLSLSHNRLRRIPASLGLLASYAPAMASLTLRGNPQRAVRPDVLERPCPDLLKYLSNRLTTDQRDAAIETIRDCRQPAPALPDVESKSKSKSTEDTASVVSVSPSTAGPVEDAPSPQCISQQQQQQQQQQQPTPDSNPNRTKNSESLSGEQVAENCGGGDAGADASGEDEDDTTKVLRELQASVDRLKAEVENLSLSQAKKYALKKSLAMERSKLIREERRLGLRK